MMGIFAETYLAGTVVKKVFRRYQTDAVATAESIRATRNEANIYMLLGNHPRIVQCLFIDPKRTYIELKYYPWGNLLSVVKTYDAYIEPSVRKHWARQILESAEYIHNMGVRHSDFRLEQWYLDDGLDVKLSDFNASGYDSNLELALEGSEAMAAESATHFLPRDIAKDSTIKSDLFALGSTLFELVTGRAPYEGQASESIEACFISGTFPNVDGLLLEGIIIGCWTQRFSSAREALEFGQCKYGL